MRRTLAFLLLALLSISAQAEVWQGRYGVQQTFDFKLYNADGTLDVDEADGGTEVSISCAEGAETTATNDFVDEGTFYSITLTATEMQCARIAVVVAATTTEVFFVQTVNNASAMTPTINSNLMTVEGTDATDTLGVAQTGDAFARLGAPAGASVSADVAAVKTDSGNLVTRVGTPSNLGSGATLAANASDIEGQTDDIGAAGAGLTAADDAVLALLGTPAGASVSADIAAVEAQTDDIGVAGAGLTAADDAVMTRLGTPAGASVSADVAAVKSDSAAILVDTGTDGVVIAEATGNCREVLGCDTQGTLSGTHSTTTADLGTNAPTNDITGMTLVIPTHNFSRAISSYNTGTGVATWADATAVTLANGNQYYLYATAPASGGGSGLDAAGVRAAVGLANPNLDTQLGAIDDAVDTEVGAIKTKTDFLPSATAGATGGVFIAGTNAATTVTTAFTSTFTGNLTGNVGGNVTGSVGSVAAGGIAATSIASDAFTAAKFAADVTTELQSGLATAAALSAVSGFVDTEIGTLLTNIGTPTDFGSGASTIAANLQDLADNGTATYDRATDSMQAIRDRGDAAWTGGGGGTADWTVDERAAMRAILGIPASGTTPEDPTDGILDDIRDAVLAGGSSNITQIEGVDATDQIDARIAAGLATYDPPTRAEATSDTNSVLTAVGDVPTNAELATALGTADDAVLAAIAALNNLSAAQLRDLVIEDQGGGVTLGCALAVIMSYAAGDLTTSSNTPTYEDPSGTETRITGTIASAGNRTMTITCPSY